MMVLIWSLVGVIAASAQSSEPQKAATPSTATLTLQSYLEQVKTHGPEARAAMEGVTAGEKRLVEYEAVTTPELFANYGLASDEKETATPGFMGTKTRSMRWQAGVAKESSFGLGGRLYFQHDHVNVAGVDTNMFKQPDFTEAKAVLELRQSLWRNGFGERTSAEIKAKRAELRAQYLMSKMELKNVLVNAENTYWALVSHHQIIALQEDNVKRAKAYRDRTSNKARQRLFDDVDAMQADAAFQERELELQQSRNDFETLARTFNTIRGRSSSTVEALEGLPEKEITVKVAKANLKLQSREDLRAAVESATAAAARARSARTGIKPKLDIVGSYVSNGRDTSARPAYQDIEKFNHPGWAVGLEFSVALDFGLLSDLRQGYKAAERQAKAAQASAEFNESRVWEDVVQKKIDAQDLFERYTNLEKLQSSLVKRERERLSNGRTTSFQALQQEGALAGIQIKRVSAQLQLIQIHNIVKQFSEEIQ